MTPLEQFNEEVKKEFRENYPTFGDPISDSVLEGLQRSQIDFIAQKLTAHKELILKMVREKVPKIKITGEGTYCQTCRQHKAAGECDCIGFNKGVQEFLNNLDTI